jgi:glycolate oxidase
MSALSQLKRALPKNTVISGSENTRPFECDGLSVYKQEPLAVVLPNSITQIKKVLEICRKNNTPIVTRGAGTGLSGGATPLEGSIVLGLSKLTHSFSIDEQKTQTFTESSHAKLQSPMMSVHLSAEIEVLHVMIL